MFNTSADDSPDRDLDAETADQVPATPESQFSDFNARYACLSARRIVSLFVNYPPRAQAAAEVLGQRATLPRRSWKILHRGIWQR